MCILFSLSTKMYKNTNKKLALYGTVGRLRTPPTPSECNCNCKSICKLNFGTSPPPGECHCNCKSINWTETLPSSKSHYTKTRTDIKNLLRTKVRYCSVGSESVVICQLTFKMAEKIDFENWRISNFKGLVTLSLDRVILHTVYITHRPLPTYQISSESEKLFVDVLTDGHLTHVIRSTLRSRPKKHHKWTLSVTPVILF